ncbi:MAG: ABC transporter ATP-binding protein [Candidatus Binatia bacterium]
MAAPVTLYAAVDGSIVVDRLEKRYGRRQALEAVTFSVHAGEIVGLLGPNGAGKSTTLSILACALRADGGRVEVAGHPLPAQAGAARRALGYVPQREALYPPLSARENLRFFGRMVGLDGASIRGAIERALSLAALETRAEEPIAAFSVGMRRRLKLACGILHRPPVVLLDEPTVGVDPQSREYIFEAITALAAEGAAVLYSTHYMEEAERLCGRVVLLDEGKIVASGAPGTLVSDLGRAPVLKLHTLRALPEDWLSLLPSARVRGRSGLEYEIEVDAAADLPSVLLAAERAGVEIRDLRLRRANLADVFFALTGRALRDDPAGEA